MKTFIIIFALALSAGMSGSAQASVIAIIDSGTDLTHKDLMNNKWTNPIDIDDAVDNDDNGLIDDINGWNFADGNNKLIDKKFLGTFSADVYKFFEVQTRLLRGEGTDADREWIQAARNNPTLIAELGTFGNFVHGTHVAGIAAKNNPKAEIMGIKLIPTKSPLPGGGHITSLVSRPATLAMFSKLDPTEQAIKMALKVFASAQGKALAPIGNYVAKEKARVANCSFGTSTSAAKSLIGPLIKLALRREPTDEEVTMYSAFFVGEIVKQAGAMIDPSKGKTMFVIAAGNDGANNDVLPTSPANYKKDNTISVAATFGYKKLASFSNFGATKVEVAAPGVGIESSIPGDLYLTVSGTSQASPFVANAVGLIIDTNPNLSNSDIKKVLMESADLKDFLKGMVSSGGIVNTSRALLAAKLAMSMHLADAIQASRLQINDVQPSLKDIFGNDTSEEGYVLPLPGFIQ